MKPTNDTIALTAFLLGRPWLAADEIRHGIERLGFEMPSSQWVAARLTLMTAESCPRFEKKDAYGYRAYRVTHWAETGLENTWDGFRRKEARR